MESELGLKDKIDAQDINIIENSFLVRSNLLME